MQTRAAPRATDSLLDGERLRAAGFIVTLYGDVVEPRGGLLWMGTLVEVCALVGISETRVRTAVSRLVAAGRLEGTRDGRRSYYRLTEAARREFAAAAARVFAPPPRRRLDRRAAARRRGRGGAGARLRDARARRCCSGRTPASAPGARGRPRAPTGGTAGRRCAASPSERWGLAAQAAAYAGFIARFAPLAADVGRGRPRGRGEPPRAPAPRPRLPRGRARRPAAARRGAARRLARAPAPAASSPTSTAGCRPPPIRSSPGASPASTGRCRPRPRPRAPVAG